MLIIPWYLASPPPCIWALQVDNCSDGYMRVNLFCGFTNIQFTPPLFLDMGACLSYPSFLVLSYISNIKLSLFGSVVIVFFTMPPIRFVISAANPQAFSLWVVYSSSSLYSNTPVIPCPVRSHSDMNPHLPYEALIALHTIPFFSGEQLTKMLTSIAQSLIPAPPHLRSCIW